MNLALRLLPSLRSAPPVALAVLAGWLGWGLLPVPVGAQRPPPPTRTGPPPPVAFVGVDVATMVDDRILSGRTVVVRDGVIVGIGPADSVEVPPGVRVIDGLNGTLVPGLIDLHAHGVDRTEFPLWLSHGVTRVQYLHPRSTLREAAQLVESGRLLGPALHLCAGPVNDVETPAEARDIVARHAADGFDCIKPYDRIEADAFRALVAEARARGVRTVAHIPRNLSWRVALEAGPDVIAHAEEFLYSPIRSRADLDLIDSLMVANRVALVPTLTNYAAIGEQPLLVERRMRHPDMAFYPPVDRRYWRRDRNPYVESFPLERTANLRRLLSFQRRLVGRLSDAGVLIGAGTDAGNTTMVPGSSLHDELEELVRAGLTGYQALRAATLDAAALLGLEGRVGQVTEGARADLVLVLGNPLNDITDSRLVAGTMVGGRWLDRDALDDLLDASRASFELERRVVERVDEGDVEGAVDLALRAHPPGSGPPDGRDPRPDAASTLRPLALNELGYQLWRIEDDLEAAVLVFEANRELHPEWWGAHASLGEAYEAAGRLDEALAAFVRAAELRPDDRSLADHIERLREKLGRAGARLRRGAR